MSYRPRDWKGYHCEELCIDCDTNPVDCNKHFEAGADAMLEALRNNQLSPFDSSVMKANFRGRVVIIPDGRVVTK